MPRGPREWMEAGLVFAVVLVVAVLVISARGGAGVLVYATGISAGIAVAAVIVIAHRRRH